MITKLTQVLFALFFSLTVAMPLMVQDALAQDGTATKSLEEMMAEVDEEAQDAQTEDGEPHVLSLDEMMEELDDAGVIDLPDLPEEDDVGDEYVAPDDSLNLPSYFWPGLILLLVLVLLLGQPLYVVIGSITVYLLYFGGTFSEFRLLTSIIEQTRGLADQPVLLAIPFFVISGALMTEGDIAQRLIRFAQSLFGWLPGGLAIAAVSACVFFAAISGSSPVTVIAIGSIMYPALVKRGYPDRFSSGLVTSAGSLGILIPPSIPMIVYAIVDPTGLKDPIGYTLSSTGGGDASVKDLFIAGVGPGMMIALVFAVYSIYIGTKFKLEKTPFDRKNVLSTFKDGFWALNLPVLILGGIYSGVFTPTQAAAVAVVYAAAVEFFIHRSIKLADVPRIFTDSAVLMGSLFIIMALALGFNLFLERAKIPDQAVQWILAMNLSVFTFLLIVNILLLIVGFFMDILSAIMILVPLLAPIAFSLGIHPLHLAIVFIVNLEIGYLTPPIGLNLFVASTLFKKGIGDIVRAVAPFVALMLCCLMLVTYVPTVSLGLVSLSKGGDFYVPFPSSQPVEKVEPGKTVAPQDAQPADKPKPGVQSLEDMMNALDDDEGEDGEGEDEGDGAVKSLEELMDELE